MVTPMDVRIGARFRALRHRLGWRQADVAKRARVSAGVVSLVECGRLECVSLAKLRSIAQALDADFVIQLRWRGGDLDRLVDEGHATMVGVVAKLLKSSGWLVRVEVSYSVYGERGSIDVLAFHEQSGVLLVVEVKTELTNVEETLRKHDEKTRLAKAIVQAQLGWKATGVARLLVLPDLSTPRRRIERHRAVMTSAYPLRGMDVRRWLSSPTGEPSALVFLAVPADDATAGPIRRKRIRAFRQAA